MMKGSAFVAAVAASCFGCSTSEEIVEDDGHEQTPTLDDDFEHASRVHDVPADLLRAISYVETRWQMVAGEEEHEGRSAGSGLFALHGDNLTAGAAAVGVSPDAAAYDLGPSLAAGAARIAELAAQRGVSGEIGRASCRERAES